MAKESRVKSTMKWLGKATKDFGKSVISGTKDAAQTINYGLELGTSPIQIGYNYLTNEERPTLLEAANKFGTDFANKAQSNLKYNNALKYFIPSKTDSKLVSSGNVISKSNKNVSKKGFDISGIGDTLKRIGGNVVEGIKQSKTIDKPITSIQQSGTQPITDSKFVNKPTNKVVSKPTVKIVQEPAFNTDVLYRGGGEVAGGSGFKAEQVLSEADYNKAYNKANENQRQQLQRYKETGKLKVESPTVGTGNSYQDKVNQLLGKYGKESEKDIKNIVSSSVGKGGKFYGQNVSTADILKDAQEYNKNPQAGNEKMFTDIQKQFSGATWGQGLDTNIINKNFQDQVQRYKDYQAKGQYDKASQQLKWMQDDILENTGAITREERNRGNRMSLGIRSNYMGDKNIKTTFDQGEQALTNRFSKYFK